MFKGHTYTKEPFTHLVPSVFVFSLNNRFIDSVVFQVFDEIRHKKVGSISSDWRWLDMILVPFARVLVGFIHLE